VKERFMPVPITTIAAVTTGAKPRAVASAKVNENAVANTHAARYSLLMVELPGQEILTAGVLLEDPATDRVHIRMRRDWERFEPDEAEVLVELEDHLLAQAAAEGAARFFARLEDTLSNTVRVSDPARSWWRTFRVLWRGSTASMYGQRRSRS